MLSCDHLEESYLVCSVLEYKYLLCNLVRFVRNNYLRDNLLWYLMTVKNKKIKTTSPRFWYHVCRIASKAVPTVILRKSCLQVGLWPVPGDVDWVPTTPQLVSCALRLNCALPFIPHTHFPYWSLGFWVHAYQMVLTWPAPNKYWSPMRPYCRRFTHGQNSMLEELSPM